MAASNERPSSCGGCNLEGEAPTKRFKEQDGPRTDAEPFGRLGRIGKEKEDRAEPSDGEERKKGKLKRHHKPSKSGKSKTRWSEEEEVRLIVAYKRFKNDWKRVARRVGTRDNGAVKNRFYTIFRKVRYQVLHDNCQYKSPLELLEMYFMIATMEDYLRREKPPGQGNTQRSVDFIFTLIQNLNLDILSRFGARLVALAAPEGNMEELLRRFATKHQIPLEDSPPDKGPASNRESAKLKEQELGGDLAPEDKNGNEREQEGKDKEEGEGKGEGH